MDYYNNYSLWHIIYIQNQYEYEDKSNEDKDNFRTSINTRLSDLQNTLQVTPDTMNDHIIIYLNELN